MSYRLEKINELIKRELAEILLKEGDFAPDVLVTVLDVQTTLDLRQAAVTFSVLPTAESTRILDNLSARIFFLQQRLNKKLKMHPVPQIKFVLNKTEAEGQRTEELLHNLKEGE